MQVYSDMYFVLSKVKPSVEEPSVSASFKEKVEEDADAEKDMIIEKLKGKSLTS